MWKIIDKNGNAYAHSITSETVAIITMKWIEDVWNVKELRIVRAF